MHLLWVSVTIASVFACRATALYLPPGQEVVLRAHCAHARFVWNLAVERQSWWRPGRTRALGYLDQCRQLTEARAACQWLRDGSQMVQQQALRDFSQAMSNLGAQGRLG